MTSLRTLVVVGMLASAVGLLGACGSGDGTSSRKEPTEAADLEGRAFVSQQISQGGADRPLAGTDPLRLEFVDGTLTAWAGCNTMSGPYGITDGKLVVEYLAGTEMACDAALMDQEQWFSSVLTSKPWVSLEGVSLSMGTADSTLLFVDRAVAQPAPALEGTTWLLTTMVDADVASSVPGGITSTLILEGDRLALLGACNRGGATASVEGDVLTIGPVMMTKMACEAEPMAIDQFIVGVLSSSPTVRIDGQNLYVEGKDRSLVYLAQR